MFSSKSIFVIGLLIVSLSGIVIVFNHLGLGLRLITYGFWILSMAVIQYTWEVKNEK